MSKSNRTIICPWKELQRKKKMADWADDQSLTILILVNKSFSPGNDSETIMFTAKCYENKLSLPSFKFWGNNEVTIITVSTKFPSPIALLRLFIFDITKWECFTNLIYKTIHLIHILLHCSFGFSLVIFWSKYLC